MTKQSNLYKLRRPQTKLLFCKINWTNFNQNFTIDLKDSQYAFIRCARKAIYPFVFNKFNQNVSKKAQNQRKKIEDFFQTNSTRPLTIQLLVFDSLSRMNFYRALNNTANFILSEINNSAGKYFSKVQSFDFLYTNSINLFTKANMIPILYGNDYNTIENEIRDDSFYNETTEEVFKKSQKKAI